MGRRGIRGLKMRVGQKCSISRGGPDCTVEIYMSEESEEGVSFTSGVTAGGSSKNESCHEF